MKSDHLLFYVYILQLNHSKYYVGRSSNAYKRIHQHILGKNSAKWVKLHGFHSVHDVYSAQTIFDEDLKTKEFMLEYGVQNVRGGAYFSPKLFEWQLNALQLEFDTALHRCFKCGKQLNRGHQCVARKELAIPYCYYCREFGHQMIDCAHL
jgi:hypothetical protein